MKIQDVKWVIDTYILESRSLVGNFLKNLSDLGIEYHETKYVPFADEQDYGPWTDCPVVLYGTFGWVQKCKIPFSPGAYGVTNNMNCNVYYPQIPMEWLLNSDYFILPFGELLRRKESIFKTFGEDIFLRPVSGGKTFAGLAMNIRDFETELSSSMQLTSVVSDTYVMIAKANPNITGEYRFVVVNGKVVAGSQYRYEGKLDVRRDYPIEAFELAEEMSKNSFQPDLIYTCDVATIRNDKPKIIELNSFSCAGLYACNMQTVITEVSKAAILEFEGKI